MTLLTAASDTFAQKNTTLGAFGSLPRALKCGYMALMT